MKINYWDSIYNSTNLENIPWQRTQSDWFKTLLDGGDLQGDTALDLGCGTGIKSVQLKNAGCKRVVGVDISKKAIEYAKNNAVGMSNIDFEVGDATNLSFLGDETYDLVLDWALLHCLPRSDHQDYLNQLLAHTKTGSLLVLRVFASDDSPEGTRVAKSRDSKTEIQMFSKAMIDQLFGDHFETLKTNISKPRNHTDRFFRECLFERVR